MKDSIFHSPYIQEDDMLLKLDQDDASDSQLYKTAWKFHEEITKEEVLVLSVKFDCDGSILTPKQSRAILMRYIYHLIETDERMQQQISFWRACGLVTGQMTPPSPRDTKATLRRLQLPSYLKERLDTIATEHGRYTERGEKWRMVEICR